MNMSLACCYKTQRYSLFDGVIDTREVRAQRSGGSSRSSGASSRRPTEQELEIARLREEARQRDEYYAAAARQRDEYYAAYLKQQQDVLQVSIIDYMCLLLAFNIIRNTNIFG